MGWGTGELLFEVRQICCGAHHASCSVGTGELLFEVRQICCGAHHASCSVGTGGSVLGDKAVGA